MAVETYAYQPDNLVAGGNLDVETTAETLAKGENLKRGALVGMLDADGTLKAIKKGVTDGTQNLYGIMTEDVDATANAAPAVVYVFGNFNTNSMIVPAGDTVAAYRVQGRKIGLIFRTAQAVPA
ncbi:MAG: head decoration protein [Bacillota bacterium]